MNGAQLVQDLIDGARQANAQVEVGPMDPGVLFKTAGAQAALEDLGLSDMEKEAIWGTVLKPALGALWKHTGGKLISGAAKPMGWLGQKAVSQVGKVSPGAAKFLGTAGQGAARDAAAFGLLSGGLNAATAEPGDRLSAFGRGFAGGALGGAAWRMGGSAARMGLGKAIGRQRMGDLYRAGRHGWFGGGAKGFGSKLVTSGVPLAGALGASMMMPTFDSQQQAQQRPQGMPYTPGQMYGAGRMLYAGY